MVTRKKTIQTLAALFLMGAVAFMPASSGHLQEDANDELGIDLDWSRIKIGFEEGIPSGIDSSVQDQGGEIVLQSDELGFVVTELADGTDPEAFMDHFLTVEGVQWVVPDGHFYTMSGIRSPLTPNPPNDPFYSSQYGPQLIQAPTAWKSESGRSGIVIAVLDTGVDMTHPDLTGNCIPHCAQAGYDVFGHGTHVAGIAAAHTNNNEGIAGVAPEVDLMAVKALTDAGTGWWSQLAIAIVAATLEGADVINMSLGGNCGAGAFFCPDVALAVNFAWNNGVLLVASSGNNGSVTQVGHPAAFPEVIAVGAVNSAKNRAGFSQGGPNLELMAPGVSILSSIPPGSALQLLCPSTTPFYASCSGTSMSAPHVAGVAGLVWSHCPSLSNVAVRGILQGTAEDRGATGWDPLYGYGIVRADLAVDRAPIC